MKKRRCDNCKISGQELFKFERTINCEECWIEYWDENKLGMKQSFADFKLKLRKLK